MKERVESHFLCYLCGRPVSITDCKYDSKGNPVHEECAVKAEVEIADGKNPPE
jgi:hypothetical protein